MKTLHPHKGFTLVELLVSMAIFVTIMAGVTLMFNSAVRVTKQGYQNQTAFETIRGAIATIERDLTNSFVNRESGHKHTFYGTPIGFTFIGVIDTDGDGNYNLARITYVMYADPSGQGLTKTYQSTADDDNDSEDRTTYSLLRYIERGVEDLESFPIVWASLDTGDLGTLNLGQEITFARNQASFDGLCLSTDPDDPCLEEVEKAKKRELWIRMLAGDPYLPRFWDTPGFTTVRSSNIVNLSRDPKDYAIAENILHISRHRTQSTLLPNPFTPDNNTTYTPLNSAPFGLSNSFIDPLGLDMAIIEPLDPLAPDPGAPDVHFIRSEAGRIWDYINNIDPNRDPNRKDVDTHQNYFFAYREFAEGNRIDEDIPGTDKNVYKVDVNGILLNDVLGGNDVPENEFDATLFAFWNDTRNLEHNNILSIVNTQSNTFPADTEDLISTQPDIIDPTLPESILIELAFFYPSPYPGAPDFEKIITHRINLPTAYKRKQESLWTKRIRD